MKFGSKFTKPSYSDCKITLDCDWLNDFISGWFPGKKIVGDNAANELKGTWGDDFIVASDGDDVIYGKLGDDFILGNGGNDKIYGGWGDDEILGGVDDDYVEGGCGDDFISGDRGDNLLSGGKGDDTFQLKVAEGYLGECFDTITDFEIGSDRLVLLGGDESLVSFVDTGDDVSVLYDGVEVALLLGVDSIPGDTGLFF